MKTQDLLFEIGCEELPPKTLRRLQDALAENIEEGLNKNQLKFEGIEKFATPRRLAVIIRALESAQPDQTVERRGPAVKAAVDKDGKPTKAALGFAASCGVEIDELGRLKTEKGEWLVYSQHIQGRKTPEIMPEIIQQSINMLPIAKKMRWGSGTVEFVRPVHWIVLIYGNTLIETEILGIKTGQETVGHRFHALKWIKIDAPAMYKTVLDEQGKVLVDMEARKEIIRSKANEAASTVNGEALVEESLLDEIAAINEWPVPVLGEFNADFLNLPKEVLITTMQSNQKYFPVKNEQDALLPYFITFSNIESRHPESIKQGNERVILPRLADAEFFWKQDTRQKLADRLPRLQNIVFQQKLGTLADKTDRVIYLAEHIATQLHADIGLAKRAAELCKTDLLTEMVGEFASLQGIMGRYYARVDGEHEDVAWALEEQYYPKHAGAPIPIRQTSKILALAEKIDTLCGIFSAGLIPTGDKDPYALRRAALGILRIIIEGNLALDVTDLVDVALAQFKHDFDKLDVRKSVIDFIYDRLKGYCLDRGFSIDEFESVMAVKPNYPCDFMQRLKAVQVLRKMPEAESLAAANKRINNILKKAKDAIPDDVVGLQQPEEKRLLEVSQQTWDVVEPMLNNKDYTAALTRLAQLKEPVDTFFDHVMVNTDDEALRKSRLALLQQLSRYFLKIADISKLQA